MKNETQILHGDCLERLKEMDDNSVDSIVTDPPYGLSFMGKKWDYDVPSEEIWRECLRVLKPGGHLLAFAGTRTQHRMAVRIEDAGFEIRDMIAWVYGSGFPKSHDVSKAMDKAAGAEREVVGSYAGATNVSNAGSGLKHDCYGIGGNKKGDTTVYITAPATEAARQWQGWGTALKPALEPITVARKPLIGTVAENVQQCGTGAINVDGCRIGRAADDVSGWSQTGSNASENRAMSGANYARAAKPDATGRWPANLIHDGSEEVLETFPAETSKAYSSKAKGTSKGNLWKLPEHEIQRYDMGGGSAARFFYCAKASKRDRDEGLEGFTPANNMRVNGPRESEEAKHATLRANIHPTVKPTDLMRYLCRLVTPPGGVVLDPFMGSGSTGKAAMLEGFNFIGIERESDYVEIAKARIQAAIK